MDSILLLNKPEGISSAGILNKLKKQWNISSLGHAGTLDPFATGLLIVGRERATKILPYFQNLSKEYLATVQLGIQTDTEDITGEIIDKKLSSVSLEQLKKTIPQFIGNIQQIPPKYSALKINGERAYKLARENKDFNMREREVYIDQMEICNFSEQEQIFTIKVVCSTGTYIRSLARDLGLALKTVATLKNLERSAIGHYRIENSFLPDQITRDSFLSIPEILCHLPSLILKPEYEKLVYNGAVVLPSYLEGSQSSEGYSPSYYLLWNEKREFFGVVDNRNSRFLYKSL